MTTPRPRSPKTGDAAICQTCGGVIEWTGFYWWHAAGRQNHVARPVEQEAEEEVDCDAR